MGEPVLRHWRAVAPDGTAFARSSTRYVYTHAVGVQWAQTGAWRAYAWTTSPKAAASLANRARSGVAFLSVLMLDAVEVPPPRVRTLRATVFGRRVRERVTHDRTIRFVVATSLVTRDTGRTIGTHYSWCETEDEALAALARAQARVADVSDSAVGAAMEPVAEDPSPVPADAQEPTSAR